MMFTSPQTRLLMLLLPSVAVSIASLSSDVSMPDAQDVGAVGSGGDVPLVATALERRQIGTKDAPVDGKDGKPHNGPWVETDGKKDPDLPPLKGRPEDPTIIDGKRIPESNDGVMDDPTRQPPKEGTRGTEGGVSEKDKARKAKEDITGEKVENKPETPKEVPPLPHSEEEKMLNDKGPKKDSSKQKAQTPGLGKPGSLPDKLHDDPHPVPDSANKPHLDIPHLKGSTEAPTTDDEGEGLIQPLHSFLLSLTMILVSEVGDKTFLVAALMAMKHDRLVVFSAAFSALLVMTLLSAILGHAVPTLIPKRLTSFLAAILFFAFGAKLLREGLAMSPDEGVSDEMHEVERELAEKEKEAGRRGSAVSPYALEMGLNGRTSRAKGRFPTPPRSPSTSPSRSPSRGSGSISTFIQGLNNLLSLLLSPAWVQTFIMTFLGEWGDRSQIATIAMAAGQDYWWVTFGAMLGHCVCTGVAVIGGRAIAGRVSMKVVTVGGALAFLLFGFIYLFEAMYA